MKILITGSSGYVAHFLATHFCNQHIPVIGLDVHPRPFERDTSSFSFYQCDIRNPRRLAEVFAQEQPTHVLHLAYLMDPQHDKRYEQSVNVRGSENVLRAADTARSVRQFVLFSSISVYGAHPDNPEKLTEESPLRPHDFSYAVQKEQVERFCNAYPKRKDMNLVILRMVTAVGPSYYKKGGVVSSFTKAPVALLLNGINTRIQFIHEKDVCTLTEKVVFDRQITGIFNLCSDAVALRELAKIQNKPVFPFPLGLMRFIAWIVWNLRLGAFTPAMVRLMAYSIITDGSKLWKRYNYQCQFSAQEAFLEAVRTRRELGRF